MLVDSHCHLDFPEFDNELEAILSRAKDRGVHRLVSIGTRSSHFSKIISLAEKYEEIYCTIGIHPHESEKETLITFDDLLSYGAHPKVIGIGETGLDYFYDHSPRDIQKKSFLTHIEAARQLKLPLIIHTREADEDTVGILTDEYKKGHFTGLIHCFSATKNLAEAMLAIGFYISVSGIITFNKADHLREIISDIPIDRLLVETDSPFLAPVPQRGKRNEPSFVVHTAQKLAMIKNLSLIEIAQKTTENFYRLFTKVPQ
jgi:TatD DNase family protein